MLERHTVIHVRGTPCSGKSTLARMLKRALCFAGKACGLMFSYPSESACFSFESHFSDLARRNGHAIKPNEVLYMPFIYILDEAQTSYWDQGMWLGFVKGIIDAYGSCPRIVFFTCYDIPTEVASRYNDGGTLAPISVQQRITLTVLRHPGAPKIGLYFSDKEMQDVVKRLCERVNMPLRLTPSAIALVTELTSGHPGAVRSVIDTVEHVSTPLFCSHFHG
jgi:hypothetical protein